jgi:hypothetical protein
MRAEECGNENGNLECACHWRTSKNVPGGVGPEVVPAVVPDMFWTIYPKRRSKRRHAGLIDTSSWQPTICHHISLQKDIMLLIFLVFYSIKQIYWSLIIIYEKSNNLQISLIISNHQKKKEPNDGTAKERRVKLLEFLNKCYLEQLWWR